MEEINEFDETLNNVIEALGGKHYDFAKLVLDRASQIIKLIAVVPKSGQEKI